MSTFLKKLKGEEDSAHKADWQRARFSSDRKGLHHFLYIQAETLGVPVLFKLSWLQGDASPLISSFQ